MPKVGCEIRIGTSGWHYDHWRGRFYPDDLPKARWLEYYSQQFDTLEINNTFYHLPKPTTFENWRRQTPAGFRFAVKASRYITHIKRLHDVKDGLDRSLEGADLLGNKLGPVLYQLPPSLHKDPNRLEGFLQLLPRAHLAVFEFRHQSWYEQDVFSLLDKYGAGFCVHDLSGNVSPRVVTGDIIYVRFHGTTGRYSGSYTDEQLADWASWIREHTAKVGAIYAYFNNDVAGHAVSDARHLIEKVRISS